MFRRKKKGGEGDDSSLPPAENSADFDDVAAGSKRPGQDSRLSSAVGATRTESARRMPEPSYTAASAPRRITAPTAPAAREHEGKRLTIGKDITLSGEITACDILEVLGRVEVALVGAKVLEIAEGGYFKGDTEVETATIAGHYEGNLTVRGTITLRGTGRITGSVRYRRVEIDLGGEVNGSMQVLAEAPPPPQPAAIPAPATPAQPSGTIS